MVKKLCVHYIDVVNEANKSYYNNMEIKLMDNRKFWKTFKPIFSVKHVSSKSSTLIEGEEIISNDNDIAETFTLRI